MIVIIGTGAVASEITQFFGNIKGYLEYDYNIEKYYNHYKFKQPILGDIDSYEFQPDDLFALGMADIPFRKKMIEVIWSKGGTFATLVHPLVMAPIGTMAGEGTIIHPNCIIEANVVMGEFNYLTVPTIIAHDTVIGDNNIFSASLLCGHVTVGNDNRFCIRSTVIPHISIGNGNTIQAGMVVTENVKDNTTVFHWYKEKIYSIKR